MKPGAPRRQRCAIYTRKSTDHNLDLTFNSLDAQREACEAYIKSQAHEGWSLIRDHFDDGAFSGASLDRPALQDLLNRVRARQVDIVVVYKVDRLTRSLADFAKLVELFDEHEVSFVSVTQSFNTTSSMGRLTLNVLLSFAQFEREVIGERVRDKIAASKRKGIWVGGPVPVGYRSVNKKLEIVPEEAALVRRIFVDYLELGSIAAVVNRLNSEGLKPKGRQLANGRIIQASCYHVGPLAYLLKNRFYIGEIAYQGEVHRGEHEPIIDRGLFEEVQCKLKDQAVERLAARRRSPHLLTGKLFDDRGNLMSPTHTNKEGVRYRYYTSHVLLQGRKHDAGTVSRLTASDVERSIADALRVAVDADDSLADRDMVDRHLHRAEVRADEIAITLQKCELPTGETCADQQVITVAFKRSSTLQKGVKHSPAIARSLSQADQINLLKVIARSRAWIEDIREDPSLDFAAIAQREGLAERHVRFMAPLAYLSPRIIEAIAEGRAPAETAVRRLAKSLPLSWADQEMLLLPA